MRINSATRLTSVVFCIHQEQSFFKLLPSSNTQYHPQDEQNDVLKIDMKKKSGTDDTSAQRKPNITCSCSASSLF